MRAIRPLAPYSQKTAGQIAAALGWRTAPTIAFSDLIQSCGLSPRIPLNSGVWDKIQTLFGPINSAAPFRPAEIAADLRDRYPRDGLICPGSSFCSRKLESKLAWLLDLDWTGSRSLILAFRRDISPSLNLDNRRASRLIATHLGFTHPGDVDQLFTFFSIPRVPSSRRRLTLAHTALKTYLNLSGDKR